MEDEWESQINDEIVIVFDGMIELYLNMDVGTEILIETLPTGSVLNPHNMLAGRRHSINARFAVNTTYYYLKYAKLVDIAH